MGGALSTPSLFTATLLRIGGSWHPGVALTCATQSEPRGDQQLCLASVGPGLCAQGVPG